jgi:hypothetical protein
MPYGQQVFLKVGINYVAKAFTKSFIERALLEKLSLHWSLVLSYVPSKQRAANKKYAY